MQKRASAGLIVPQFAHGAVTSWECRDEMSDRTAPRRRPYPLQDPEEGVPMKRTLFLPAALAASALVLAACSNNSTTPPAGGGTTSSSSGTTMSGDTVQV